MPEAEVENNLTAQGVWSPKEGGLLLHQNHTCWAGTLLANNLSKSLALMITKGSKVLRVVLTVIDPSTCKVQARLQNGAHVARAASAINVCYKRLHLPG